MRKIAYLIIALQLFAAGGAWAQTNITLGAINADPTAPLDIVADSLAVDQESGRAVFSGNVLIGQGDLRLSAGEVRVLYNDATGDVDNLSMRGGVTFVTATEAAESQSADYDLQSGTLELVGDVLLTQGNSAISAERMRINLEDGSAVMDGRVRTILNQDDG